MSLLQDGHEVLKKKIKTTCFLIISVSTQEHSFDFGQDWGDSQILMNHIYDLIGTTNNRQLSQWEVYNVEGDILWSIDRMVYEGKWH